MINKILTKKGLLIIFIFSLAFTVGCTGFDKGEVVSRDIIIYGDSRTGEVMHQRIVDNINKFNPKIVLHTGDLVEDGSVAEQWESFNNITEDMRQQTEFFPALGNHERNSQLYFDNFQLPNNERWYSIDRLGIHFIVLDSNIEISSGTAQYIWLENDLKNTTPDDFVVMVFHHPLFSSGPHGGEAELRDELIPLIEGYDVDIVFNGHDHDYERSLYNDTYYIVSGGGGAPIYEPVNDNPYRQKFSNLNHFCALTLEEDLLEVKVFDVEMKIIDRFNIGR